MTMIFSLHDSIAPNLVIDPEISTDQASSKQYEHPYVRSKYVVPAVVRHLGRDRIQTLLKRSAERFPATLICGRAGTGKTAAAAAFARERKTAYWYSTDSTDTEWASFSPSFAKCVVPEQPADSKGTAGEVPDQVQIARYLINLFSPAYGGSLDGALIVMDDIHHLYETPWFDEFFNLLIYSLPPDVHLMVLCRSKPPAPLWRLRSKQMLNLIDEKVLAFDIEETKALFDRMGVPTEAARNAHRSSFGRVSKLLEIAGSPVF